MKLNERELCNGGRTELTSNIRLHETNERWDKWEIYCDANVATVTVSALAVIVAAVSIGNGFNWISCVCVVNWNGYYREPCSVEIRSALKMPDN